MSRISEPRLLQRKWKFWLDGKNKEIEYEPNHGSIGHGEREAQGFGHLGYDTVNRQHIWDR
jgi:hypothetical protein